MANNHNLLKIHKWLLKYNAFPYKLTSTKQQLLCFDIII